MDLEKNPMNVKRNPNNDLKYFSDIKYQSEKTDDNISEKKDDDQDPQPITYITE